MKSETDVIQDSVYPFVATHRVKGWPRSGFDLQTTEVKVRRVICDGTEEVQCEIQIIELKGKRLYRHNGSLVLHPEQVKALVKALQELKA